MSPEQLAALLSGLIVQGDGASAAARAEMDAGAAPVDDPSSGESEVGPLYTMQEVAQHNSRDDCWIAIAGGVYDVTEFMSAHPGGAGMLKMVAGHDATQHFEEMHRPEILTSVGSLYRIGKLDVAAPA